MKNHSIKAWPVYFQVAKTGEKTFDERVDDRGYKVGDTLTLQEFDPEKGEYTGDELVKRVTYILREPYAKDGHVIMSLVAVGNVPMNGTLTKKDILLYGALLESDMYVDGYGSTDEDTVLLKKALKKVYGIGSEFTSDEEAACEKQLNEDLKALVVEMRGLVTSYVNDGSS